MLLADSGPRRYGLLEAVERLLGADRERPVQWNMSSAHLHGPPVPNETWAGFDDLGPLPPGFFEHGASAAAGAPAASARAGGPAVGAAGVPACPRLRWRPPPTCPLLLPPLPLRCAASCLPVLLTSGRRRARRLAQRHLRPVAEHLRPRASLHLPQPDVDAQRRPVRPTRKHLTPGQTRLPASAVRRHSWP